MGALYTSAAQAALTSKPPVFILESALNPAIPGSPTVLEISNFSAIQGHASVLATYNGTEIYNDDPTRVWAIGPTATAVPLTLSTGGGAGITDGNKGSITVTAGGSVWTLNDNAVTTTKIIDGAVTEDKIADGAITLAKLAGGTPSKLSGFDGVGDPAELDQVVVEDVLTSTSVTSAVSANMARVLNEKMDALGTVEHNAADIAARDLLTDLVTGDRVFVTDASADATVDLGWAVYRWDGAAFLKMTEAESLDLVLAGNVAIFADNATLAQGVAGEPTDAELLTFAGTAKDVFVFYTGDSVSTNKKIIVVYIDEAQSVIRLVEPIADGAVTTSKIADNAVTLDKMAGGTPLTFMAFDVNGDPAEATPSGGLPQQGAIPAVITEQGIYLADGVNATTALYAATGSQDRVMILSDAAGVGTVISVQSGETLNLDADGSYTTLLDGEILLFVDKAVGAWTLQPLGMPSAVDPIVIDDVSQVTSTTTVIATGTPPENQISITSLKHWDVGSIRYVYLEAEIYDDEIVRMSLGTDVVPTGARIVSANGVHIGSGTIDTSNHRPSVYVENANTFTVNRSDNDQDGVGTIGLQLVLDGVEPSIQYAMAGMHPTANLESGFVEKGENEDLSVTGGYGSFEDIDDLTITVPGAGRWEITATINADMTGADDDGGVFASITNSSDVEVQDGNAPWVVRVLDSVASTSLTAEGTVVMSAYVTTSGAETFKVRAGQAGDGPQNRVLAGSHLRYEQKAARSIVYADPSRTEAHAFESITVYMSQDTPTTKVSTDVHRTVFDAVFGQEGTSYSLNGDGTVSLIEGRRYHVTSAYATSNISNAVIYDFANQTKLGTTTGANESFATAGGPSAVFTAIAGMKVGLLFNRPEYVEGDSANSFASSMVVQEIPSREFVTPGDVPLSDRRVLLGASTGVLSNQAVSIGARTWGGLEAEGFESVEFEVRSNTTEPMLFVKKFPTQSWTNDTIVEIYRIDSTKWLSMINLDILQPFAVFADTGFGWSADIKIYGIKAQKNVISANDVVVNDQSASGYFDVGNERFQRGSVTHGGNDAIVFPAPFASDTSYSITGSPTSSGLNNVQQTVEFTAKTATGVTGDLLFASSGAESQAATGSTYDWIAIGRKP